MINRLLTLYSRSLRRRFSDTAVDKIFRRLPPCHQAERTEKITLCALQLEAKTYPNPESWLRELDSILEKAASKGARLICLPELYGMLPCLCHPLLHWALKRLSGGNTGGDTDALHLDLLPVMEKLSAVNGIYEDMICRFARRHGVYLYGGTAFVADGGKLFNRGFLASPEGKVLSRQDKLHLTQEEMALGLSTGDTLAVVPTEIGNIALCVCMDATYFETFRAAKALGADYIIVPIGDMAEFDPWLALRGAQTRVSETWLPAVKPALVSGNDFPILFTGKAGIYFPAGSPFRSEETLQHRGIGMVLSEIDLQQLRHCRTEPFIRNNPGFARNYYQTLQNYTEGEYI